MFLGSVNKSPNRPIQARALAHYDTFREKAREEENVNSACGSAQ